MKSACVTCFIKFVPFVAGECYLNFGFDAKLVGSKDLKH